MTKNLYPVLIVIVAVLFVQCKHEALKIKPNIKNLSDFESNDGAISISITGGKAPYAVSWSNQSNDTVINKLMADIYYVTVTDSKKSTLIDTIEVTQPPWPVCIDAQGNDYKTAIVGNQTWMLENLKVRTNPTGDSIESFVYNDSIENESKYGRLYTWHAAMNDSVNEGAQGVCPDGWHIPTDEDWSLLIDNISTADKEIPNIKKSLNLAYAGFYNNGYHNIESSVSFWTSTQAHNNAWKRYFNKNLSKAFRYHESKSNAISVRCVKNN